MTLALIAAVAENGVIGRGGALPWRLSADLRRFKALTMGHAVIMGRKTWESIARALPGRKMIVVTRRANYAVPAEVAVAATLEEAIALAGDDEVAFVIGGGEIYRLALPQAQRLYVTRVLANVDGDASFPDVDWSQWRLIRSESHAADERNELAFRFEDYERAERLSGTSVPPGGPSSC